MNWTNEQAHAIELRDKNILVAAAAGSGKTAVLVERIKRLVLEDRCPIDKMLIVTFTNAAAAEMKEKIEKALTAAISGAAKKEDMIFLKKQLDLLPTANISTFHAFALDVIRRYFYLINIEPDFKICDETQQTILKEKALDTLLENYYENSSDEFYVFLKKYSGDRNDSKLREMIKLTYETIQSLPEPYEWLSNAVEQLNCSKEEFASSETVSYLMGNLENQLHEAIELMGQLLEGAVAERIEGAAELISQDINVLNSLRDVVLDGDFDKTAVAINSFKMATASKKYFDPKNNSCSNVEIIIEYKEKLEAVRKPLKDIISKAKKDIFFADIAEHHRMINATYEDAVFLKKLVENFDELYSELKQEKKLADFNDIEHYAYKILGDEEAAGFYRKKFNHIFIDEYQDSNILQEALVGKICRENNLFMVGDVKQSIYKFRLAEPEIFQRKYKKYAEKSETLSEKIDLNKNFRSKKPIVDFINSIFEKTMEGYDDNAALYVGDPNGDKCDLRPKLYLVEKKWAEEEQLDDELKLLIKAEKEALAAAAVIRSSLGKTFFDSKKGCERQLEKKDIVILMRGVKNYGDIFYKILAENNLPAYVDDNDGYFDTMEINTFMALLLLLDNEKQDIPLLTVMRSEIMGFGIEEMVEIRLAHKDGSYYDAFMHYANSGEDVALRQKCEKCCEDLRNWKEMSRLLPLEELVWSLMLSTGFYAYMGAMPAGMQRQANLRALVDKALAYSGGQDGSLYGFINYIEAVKKRKVSMGQVKMVAEDDDTIRIMTIHKSKGLEFPMVLVSGFCRKLNYTAIGHSVAIHKDVGIGLPLINYSESWYKTTLIQTAIKIRVRQEELEEEKRVLYVALTRARDVLALLGISENIEDEVKRVIESFPKDSSYMSLVGKLICTMADTMEYVTDADLIGISKGRKRSVARAVGMLEQPAGAVDKEIEERMTFEYPYEKELGIKSKYAVSDFAEYKYTEKISLADPKSFGGANMLTSAQVGTITHKVLEKTDFSRALKIAEVGDVNGLSGKSAATAYFDQLLKEMVDDEFLSEDEAAVVDCASLGRFVLSPLGKRIANSPEVYKEKPFNCKIEVDGVSTIVQGVIDCYFVEDGELILVDYKTTNLIPEELSAKKGQLIDRYGKQMKIYKEALEAATGLQVKETLLYLTNIGEVIKC